MTGMPTLETFCVYGVINHQRVIIHVDGGSTHNFFQTWVAKFLGLPSSPMGPLQVMVGNGNFMQCQSLFTQVLITVQGHVFTIGLSHSPYLVPTSFWELNVLKD